MKVTVHTPLFREVFSEWKPEFFKYSKITKRLLILVGAFVKISMKKDGMGYKLQLEKSNRWIVRNIKGEYGIPVKASQYKIIIVVKDSKIYE